MNKELVDIFQFKIELEPPVPIIKVRANKNNLERIKEYVNENKEEIIKDNLIAIPEYNKQQQTKQELFDRIQKKVIEYYDYNNNKSDDRDDDGKSYTDRSSSLSQFDSNTIASYDSTNEDNFSQISSTISFTQSQTQEYQPRSLSHRLSINSAPKTLPSYDKSKFAFFKSSSNDNFNQHITTELQKILDYHSNEGKKFEALAYRKAISQIKNHKTLITNISQIKKIRFIGDKIEKKIGEILNTGTCSKGNFVSKDAKNNSIKELCQVWGIGIKQANEFYRKGIRTISDLKANEDTLASNIKKGLKYYEDIKIKIPREEITMVFSIIKEELISLLPEDIVHCEVCGSYRRGKAQCGDLDIIITRIDDGMIEGILPSLLEKLRKKKLIREELSGSSDYLFMGIYQIDDKPFRRIDIKVYHKDSFPFALLYFTGSAYFNRSLRLFAKKIGFHLSDKGLLNNTTGETIQCSSEKEIFESLGIDYKEPNERDI